MPVITKLSNTRWDFGGFLLDLDEVAYWVDAAAECSHHPRNSLAYLRSAFEHSVGDALLDSLWSALLNINNKAMYIPDEAFRALGPVTYYGTWRHRRNGKVNGYPFPPKDEWEHIVEGQYEYPR